MADSIFVRVQRVLSVGVESAAGAVERASGGGLMREAIRQVDRSAEEIRDELHAAKARRDQAAFRKKGLRDRLATLEEQARFAVGKGREDLAEAALARQLDYEAEIARLDEAQAQAADEIGRLEECFAALKVRKNQMEKELAAFQAAQREADCAAPAASPIDRTERKVTRAEATFERAMAAAGVPGAGLMDPAEAAKLAEVDALRREDKVAQRLAALKAAQDKKRPAKASKAR